MMPAPIYKVRIEPVGFVLVAPISPWAWDDSQGSRRGDGATAQVWAETISAHQDPAAASGCGWPCKGSCSKKKQLFG
jgi:hypothetical protein